MVAGAYNIPKGTSCFRGRGDDAHFICEERHTIGVADGVGGWGIMDIDPGEYARQLMANSLEAILMEPEGKVDLERVLNQAYSKTKVKGASTACILTLIDNCLHVANLGDSGFLLIRKEEIYKSEIQEHYFNRPFQLGQFSDTPDLAEIFPVDVKAGDMLIVGTDGLFDNMFERQIRDIARLGAEVGLYPEQVAWAIAEHAYHNSMKKKVYTPFMKAAKNSGRVFSGGKPDDITVMVAYIVDA
ncbi:hypothetical protein FH972_011981 [Carpinus fangiana]|uniref:Protein phosphatase n=1 Tax=Carpinus fangiana TaxID=176857 RepID=A0A5N6R2F1_9ROSI|nr:hypothetical protein FH972_011981 [Carpinus fangiana]